MGRPRQYANAAAKQAAYRQRKHGQASTTAPGLSARREDPEQETTLRLIALQADCAQQHVVGRRVPSLSSTATAEQRRLQAELKERDMLDALWILQTLIADFGYDEVYTHVLQHLTPDAQ